MQLSGCPSQTSTVLKLLSAHSDGVVDSAQLSVRIMVFTSMSSKFRSDWIAKIPIEYIPNCCLHWHWKHYVFGWAHYRSVIYLCILNFAFTSSGHVTHLKHYALSLPVYYKPQTTRLHPAPFCAVISIFLQLYLKPAVHISISRSLFQVFLDCPLPLWPCDIYCSTRLAILSSLCLSVCLIQFHFLLRSYSKTGC